MEFLKTFKSDSDFFSNATNLPSKNVSYTRLEGNVWFDIQRKIYKTNCLTFTAVSGGSGPGPSPGPEVSKSTKSGLSKSSSDTSYITIYTSGSTSKNIEYSFDNGVSWKKLTLSSSGGGGGLRGGSVSADGTITLKKGESVSFRGVNDNLCGQNQEFNFRTSGTFKVSGDVTSLLNGVGGDVDLTDRPYCFSGLFENCKIITPPRLPSTKLSVGCYANMFRCCNSLTTAPELPATTLEQYCYQYMFYGCESLTTAPELPATTLEQSCYQYMFYDCYSLTTAPELPATTLANNCYAYMFYLCNSLTTAPELPATTLEQSCYAYMFYGCNSLTTPPELPATTLEQSCYYGMFQGCVNLTSAPQLQATTLASSCYQNMFYGCTSLTSAPELPATTLAQYCYYQMFYGCTSLNYIKCLATNIGVTGCTTNWVQNVSATGTFVKDVSMSNWTTGNNGIPSGWTVQNYVEPISFTALEDNSSVGWTGTYPNLEYSTDGSTWTAFTEPVSVNTGDKVMFRNNGTAWTATSNSSHFTTTGTFNLSGNIMSLVDATMQTTTIPMNHCFNSLFRGNSIVDSSNLVLPATTLAQYCYAYMFSGCTALTTAPEIPATTLARLCCYQMFDRCTSLTTAPELPAKTLASGCYQNMFNGCRSLTTAPELPAKTLASSCYQNMFQGCVNLTSAPQLQATTLASNCYQNMFNGCRSLTTAPELPATKLASNCYNLMFQNCTSLNYIKCLATNIGVTGCTTNWVQNVSATGTFVKDVSMSNWTTGNNGIPSGWTVQNA